jgi:hypothetical protein
MEPHQGLNLNRRYISGLEPKMPVTTHLLAHPVTTNLLAHPVLKICGIFCSVIAIGGRLLKLPRQ